MAKQNLEAKKTSLDADISAHEITAARKIAIERDLVNQEYQLDLQRLENELSTLTPETVEYDCVYNQIRLPKKVRV